MSNYTKSTDFTAKDSLPSGDSQKVIRGSEFDTEFSALATAVNSKADKSGDTVVLTAGTVSAPSLTTVSDTNTGIYFPAADKVAIATGGTQRVIVDDLGNVGIGTSSPGSRLDVQSASSANAYRVANIYNSAATGTTAGSNVLLRVASNGSGADSTLVLTDSTSTNGFISNNNGNLLFGNGLGFTERMRLDSSGNLGIGTSTTTNGRLNVQAGTAATGNSAFFTNLDGTYNSYLQIQHSSAGVKLFNGNSFGAAANNLIFGNSGVSETMRIDANGNLGLGVTPSGWVSGAKAFQAGGYASFGQGRAGTSDLVASWNAIVTSGTSSGTGYVYRNTGDVASSYEQNGQHRWYTAPSGTAGAAITFTQAMTLDASGNLTVGPSTSNTTLTAAGNVSIKNTANTSGFDIGLLGGGLDLNAFIYQRANGYLAFGTNNTERARITSGGSWLVGTTAVTTSSLFSSVPAGVISASGDISLRLFRPTTQSGNGVAGLSFAGQDGSGNQVDVAVIRAEIGTNSASGALLFQTLPSGGGSGTITERARITSNGDLLVGTTTDTGNRLAVYASTGTAIAGVVTDNASQLPLACWSKLTSGDNLFASFGTEASYTPRGTIDYNRAGGLVRYNTTSDYRAKDIIGPVQNPGATIDALKVYEGKMKDATQSRPMLVAHEAQEHAPYAVSGVKDELNEDGTPKFQQMDVSSLVPLLLAEIQSLRTRVATLENN